MRIEQQPTTPQFLRLEIEESNDLDETVCEMIPKNIQLVSRGTTKQHFVPQKFIWVLVLNKNYDLLRQQSGYESFHDLTHVENDAKNTKAGFKQLGAKDRDMLVFEDLDVAGF